MGCVVYAGVIRLMREHPSLSDVHVAQLARLPLGHVRLLRAGHVPAGAVADVYRSDPYAQVGDVARTLGVGVAAVVSVLEALRDAHRCFVWGEPDGRVRVSVHYDAPTLREC